MAFSDIFPLGLIGAQAEQTPVSSLRCFVTWRRQQYCYATMASREELANVDMPCIANCPSQVFQSTLACVQ